MQMNSIGMLELNSIAAGIQVTDKMLKTADVDLIVARSICSGKYMVIIGGMIDAVKASVEAGNDYATGAVIDTLIIANVDAQIFSAISGANVVTEPGALGVIESFSVASLIEAADTAVDTADVQLVEIRLAMALGGKAYVTLTGRVDAVQAAVDAGAEVVAKKGLLVNKVVIPAPSPELYRDYI